MTVEDILGLMIPVTFFVMLAIESLFKTGRAWPAIPWWKTKGIAFFVVIMGLNVVLPSLVPPQIASHHLFNTARLGVTASVVIGYLCVSFASAAVHRAYHRYPLLWRVFHQLHH